MPIAVLAAAIAGVSALILPVPLALVSCALGWTMLAIAIIDARQFIVPDVLSLPSIPFGFLAAHLLDDRFATYPVVLDHAVASLLGGAALYAIRGLYYLWRNSEGLGLGDVKLAAAAGAWVGLAGLGPTLLLASVLAIGCVILSNIGDLRAIRGNMAVPFGVFLAPSIWFVWCATMLGPDLAVPPHAL